MRLAARRVVEQQDRRMRTGVDFECQPRPFTLSETGAECRGDLRSTACHGRQPCTSLGRAPSTCSPDPYSTVASGSSRLGNAGPSERSMSSENRVMTPNTFESDVPPLNTIASRNEDSKSAPRSQQTQKSFSRMTGDRPRRPPLHRCRACARPARDRNASVMMLRVPSRSGASMWAPA